MTTNNENQKARWGGLDLFALERILLENRWEELTKKAIENPISPWPKVKGEKDV